MLPIDETPQDEMATLSAEYEKLAHAIQTGIKTKLELDRTKPHARPQEPVPETSFGSAKHLRTGLQCRRADHAGLVDLLVDMGIITKVQYLRSINKQMRLEVQEMEQELSSKLGTNVSLA